MSTYTAQTPSSNGTTVAPQIIKFYEQFFKISDDPSDEAHNQYVNSFTKDATLNMGSKSAVGSEAIMGVRKYLWAGPVISRVHTVEKIYPWDKEGNEIMLYGNVLYGLTNGTEHKLDWAGRALLEGVHGDSSGIKMKFYQVYLDSGPVARSMQDL